MGLLRRLGILGRIFNVISYVHPGWDACYLDMERDLGYFVRTMSILARFIVNQQKKAQNYRTECLRYRGVAYKK